MRPPKSKSSNVSGGSNNNNGGPNNNSGATSAAAVDGGGVASDATTTAAHAQARRHTDGGNTDIEAAGEGVVLPSPEGGVEVREFDGGVLVVRRNEEEKKRSPERLNLHRRRLKSCPVVQVGGSRFDLTTSLLWLSE